MNSTVGLTLLLLLTMGIAGAISTTWGYNLGKEALQGITSPDSRPNSGGDLSEVDPETESTPQPLVLIDEKTVLSQIQTQISGQTPTTTAAAPPAPEASPAPDIEPVENPGRSLPRSATSKDVTLTIDGVRSQGGTVLLDVELKNRSQNLVQFLYSFLEVTDELGRPVSAIVEDLPNELPPGNISARGVISIPSILLDGVLTVNVRLTDYPEQTIELNLNSIPISQEATNR
ncbi:MAG: hypothetical protein AAGF75_01645 [Cyanobacteria bacterium P01_H01_bin.130]